VWKVLGRCLLGGIVICVDYDHAGDCPRHNGHIPVRSVPIEPPHKLIIAGPLALKASPKDRRLLACGVQRNHRQPYPCEPPRTLQCRQIQHCGIPVVFPPIVSHCRSADGSTRIPRRPIFNTARLPAVYARRIVSSWQLATAAAALTVSSGWRSSCCSFMLVFCFLERGRRIIRRRRTI
jgi:hypothetical protein